MHCIALYLDNAFTALLNVYKSYSNSWEKKAFSSMRVRPDLQFNEVAIEFTKLSKLIETKIQADGNLANEVPQVLIATDICGYNVNKPNPLAADPYESLLGMLILAFPEVLWVIGGEAICDDSRQMSKIHSDPSSCTANIFSLANLFANGFSPLFDPGGLRDIVRKNADLPTREKTAVSIDDEPSFAFFHGYAAFRMGYRTEVVHSLAEMERCLGADDGKIYDIVFEDMYLSFPDRREGFHLSKLKERDLSFPKLLEAKGRFLITMGHSNHADGEQILADNVAYLSEKFPHPRLSGDLYKPSAGIYDLWRELKSLEKKQRMQLFRNTLKNSEISTCYEKVKKRIFFHLPVSEQQKNSRDDSKHSAPGRILIVAQKLIDRSEIVLEGAQTAPVAIYAAVLALEAKEILKYKTPTTALEALALQHEAEVVAETMFCGTRYNLKVKPRVEDIKREVILLSHYFSEGVRKMAELNATLVILEGIAKRFAQFNQFEEQNTCLAEARKVRFDCGALESARNHPLWLGPLSLGYPLKVFAKIGGNMFSSLSWFLGMVIATVLFFGVLYHYCVPIPSWSEAMAESLFLSLTGQPIGCLNGNLSTKLVFICSANALFTLSFIGLLISHLYMLVSRK